MRRFCVMIEEKIRGGKNLENQKTKENEKKKDGSMKHYLTIAMVVFFTFCCCILFFFLIYRYNGFTEFWKKLMHVLQPIIIGLVIAYLLNPVMSFLEKHIFAILKNKMKHEEQAKKLSRGIGIFGALIFLVGVIVLLIASIVPSIVHSMESVVTGLPAEIKNLSNWVEEITKGDSQLADMTEKVLMQGTAYVKSWFDETLIPQAQTYVTSIISSGITFVKSLLNVLVGLIVSVYVMASKETFAGQGKKVIYAVFKPEYANVVVETVRKSNEIFGGFISGKILDSAIIGVLAYIVMSIMKMPDTVLLAVIIGVTNIIPFFGPFIGAIPSFIIIVLQNPIQGLYFLIFIFILQQVDGNIIGPKILGDSTGLSSFWVVFAIMIFGGLWGFLGMLLGVPIMAVIYYIGRRSVAFFLRKKNLPEDTDSYIYMMEVDKDTNELLYEKKHIEKEKTEVSKEEKKDENDTNHF